MVEASVRQEVGDAGEELAHGGTVRQPPRVAAGMDDQGALAVCGRLSQTQQVRAGVKFGQAFCGLGQRGQDAQGGPAGAEAPAAGVGDDMETRGGGQQAPGASPVELAAHHLGLVAVAGGEDAQIPAARRVQPRLSVERFEVALPVVAARLL